MSTVDTLRALARDAAALHARVEVLLKPGLEGRLRLTPGAELFLKHAAANLDVAANNVRWAVRSLDPRDGGR